MMGTDCSSRFCMLIRLLSMAALLHTTDAQSPVAGRMEDICSYASVVSGASDYSVGVTYSTQWTSTGHCQCDMTSTSNTHVELEVTLGLPEDSPYLQQYWNKGQCAPLMFMDVQETDYYVCPARSRAALTNNRRSARLRGDQPISFHIHNPRGLHIINTVKITAAADTKVQLSCHPTTQAFNVEDCPCHGEGGFIKMGTVNELQTDDALAASLPIVLLLIIAVVLIEGYICYRKRREASNPMEEHHKPQTSYTPEDARPTGIDHKPQATYTRGEARPTGIDHKPQATYTREEARPTGIDHKPQATYTREEARPTGIDHKPQATYTREEARPTGIDHKPQATYTREEARPTGVEHINRAYDHEDDVPVRASRPSSDARVSLMPDPGSSFHSSTPRTHSYGQDMGIEQISPYATSHSQENVSSIAPNHPALAGQGSQSSLDNPPLMTAREVDALYAKPHKTRPPSNRPTSMC